MVLQVWDYCIVKDDLKKLINTTYSNKMHLPFGTPSYMNISRFGYFKYPLQWMEGSLTKVEVKRSKRNISKLNHGGAL